MKQNLWWPTAIWWDWITDGMTLTLRTFYPTNLVLYWTMTPPVMVPFYRTQRGITTLCGYTWRLTNTIAFPQNEPGLNYGKTFTVHGWPVCRRAWWYFMGSTPRGPSISTSIIYHAHFPGLPGPPIPALPEIIVDEAALIHNGNHYAWWSSPHWYAALPFPDSLRVYQRTTLGWVRLDQANEPTFPPGQFSDMDSRLDLARTTLHIVAYLKAAAYPPDTIMYYTFDIVSATWKTAEAIAQNTTDSQPNGMCSLSLDSNDKPHVIYDGQYTTWQHCYYTNRVNGSWLPRASFYYRLVARWNGHSATHDTLDTFHGCSNSFGGYSLFYNHRPAGGPIQAHAVLDTSIVNLWGPAIASWNTTPNIPVTDYDFSLEHFTGPAPWTKEPAIFPPYSRYPCAITPPTATNRRYIIFAYGPPSTQGLYWQAGVWTPFSISDTAIVHQIAATYTLPTLFQYVAITTFPDPHTRFWAITPPL